MRDMRYIHPRMFIYHEAFVTDTRLLNTIIFHFSDNFLCWHILSVTFNECNAIEYQIVVNNER